MLPSRIHKSVSHIQQRRARILLLICFNARHQKREVRSKTSDGEVWAVRACLLADPMDMKHSSHIYTWDRDRVIWGRYSEKRARETVWWTEWWMIRWKTNGEEGKNWNCKEPFAKVPNENVARPFSPTLTKNNLPWDIPYIVGQRRSAACILWGIVLGRRMCFFVCIILACQNEVFGPTSYIEHIYIQGSNWKMCRIIIIIGFSTKLWYFIFIWMMANLCRLLDNIWEIYAIHRFINVSIYTFELF